jgi:hypothetical protein
VHTDHCDVVAEGKLVDLQPQSTLAEGAVIDVKLGEIDLHDATAGAGKVDGIDVVVAGGAKLVGKTSSVRIGRVFEGVAFATLSNVVEPPIAITFESEAEKPTRAPARRKVTETDAAEALADDEIVDDLTEDDALVLGDEAEREGADVEEDAEDGAEDGVAVPPKKRTRRGSRGGRRRKKPGAVTDGVATDSAGTDGVATDGVATDEEGVGREETDDAPDVGTLEIADAATASAPAPRAPRPRARRTPKIHVPDAAEGDDAPAARSRGPRVAAADRPGDDGDGAAAVAASTEADGEEAVVGAGPGGAPRKRTRRGSRGGRGRGPKAGAVDGETAIVGVGLEASVVESTDVTDTPAAPAALRAPARPRQRAVPVADTPAEPAETQAPRSEGSPDGYVPMSEWIDDFDRPRRDR